MGKIVKILFYTYVIALAGLVTYRSLLLRSFGEPKAQFIPSQKECFKGGEDWKYCVHTSEQTDRSAYLYIFHGRGMDENFWHKGETYSGLLQQFWQQGVKRTPLPITISFGDTWVVTKKMSKPKTGLMERFQSEVFPVIEQNLGQPKHRMIMGSSMGALNALTVALEMNQYFSRVVALCPPVFTLSPFDRWHKVLDFARRTGAQPKSIITIIGLGRSLFSNTEEWLEFSPLEKIKKVKFTNRPHYYLTAGTRDEFGIFEGVELFVQELQKTPALTYWRPNSGDHCAVDIKSLANFLEVVP